MKGATKISSEIICRTICYPSTVVVAEADAAEAEHQQSTWPKELALWQVMQMDPSEWGEATGIPPPQKLVGGVTFQEPQIALGWAKYTTAFKWRETRSHELSESREWGLQSPSQSQSLVGLLERFGQLSMGNITQLPPRRLPGWILTQPMFTFPGQGGMTVWSGVSVLFHLAQCGSHLNLPHRVQSTRMTAPTGTGASQQQGPQGQSSLILWREMLLLLRLNTPPHQPPPRLPLADQILPG